MITINMYWMPLTVVIFLCSAAVAASVAALSFAKETS